MKPSMDWGGQKFTQTDWPNVCAVIEELEIKQGAVMAALMERERFITEQLKAKKLELEAND